MKARHEDGADESELPYGSSRMMTEIIPLDAANDHDSRSLTRMTEHASPIHKPDPPFPAPLTAP